jgi:hypothetical protein
MANYWKERHRIKEWTKRIDISFLYQLGTIAAQMMKRAEEDEDKRLFDWAAQIRLIVARANGEELNIPLAEHCINNPTANAED